MTLLSVDVSRKNLLEESVTNFQEVFGAQPTCVASAPGRVNLIGEHTDYNQGFVLPVAIDRSVITAAGPRDDGQLAIYSKNFNSMIQVPLDNLSATSEDGWSNYAKGVACFLLHKGHRLRGANLCIAGNIPEGIGLGSSAALEVSVAYSLCALNEVPTDDLELIKLCQQVENEFVGISCGIMDQFISVSGRKDHALFLDCSSLGCEYVPFPSGVTLMVCFTGVKHELSDSAYNLRREECLLATKLLADAIPSVRALRDVSLEQFERHRRLLNPTLQKRCKHVISESHRVTQAVEALKRGELLKFGSLMYQSHLSLKADYEVSCAELDAIVDICAEAEGVYGARMTGAGFGGSAICLVKDEYANDVIARLEAEYPKITERESSIFTCTIEDGVDVRRV
jgi:galactokinase